MQQSGPAVDPRQTQTDVEERKITSGRILGVRPRVIALILITQAVMIWWVADSEIARGIYLICYSLMMPTVLYLLCVRVLRKWLPFEDKELLLGYIVLTATIPIIGFGGLRFLIPGMGYMPYFAEMQPQWAKYLSHLTHLPLLHDRKAALDLFQGGSSVPWQAWIVPIGFWSAYLMILSGIWLGLAGVLRRIWVHQERLTFPIAVMPLQLTDPKNDIFRRPLFWFGFAVPAVLQSLLVFHDWAPSIPAFQLRAFDAAPMIFTSRPWNAIPSLPVGFYPMAVGLAFFVPSDVSFSCWFFWLVGKLSYVVGSAAGIDAAGTGVARFPYRDEQGAGAWIAFALLLLWGARHHWKTVVKSIPADERTAVRRLGALAALGILLCAGMMTMIGVKPLAALGVILVYAAYVLSGARVRAESGGQWTFAPLNFTPPRVVSSFTGTEGLQTGSLVAGGYLDLVHVDIRGQSLPYLMEGLKTAESAGIRWRTVMLWVAIGTVTALALGWWSSLTKFYALGAATAKVDQYAIRKVLVSLNNMDQLANNPRPWDRAGVTAMLFAGLFTWLLAFLRTKITGFPFHPVGFVLGNTLTMNSFFVPFFLAWAAKVLILRLGGASVYRRAMLFFVGLVLGDVVTQAFWALVGGVFGVPIYQFLT